MDTPFVAVEVPLVGDERRKSWAKVVTAVDESKASGWAYDGEFVATGGVQDVPAGAVLLVYGERGSRANPQIEARVYRANADGTLSHHASARGRAWARTLRDAVAELLTAEPLRAETAEWDAALMRYTTEALREELGRRGAGPGGAGSPS
jgi:hypothetical protein